MVLYISYINNISSKSWEYLIIIRDLWKYYQDFENDMVLHISYINISSNSWEYLLIICDLWKYSQDFEWYGIVLGVNIRDIITEILQPLRD